MSISSRARKATVAMAAIVLLGAAVGTMADRASAEQASQPGSSAAGRIDVSAAADRSGHTCALISGTGARCWGFGGDGRLGYGNVATIGDDESPGSAGPVDLGAGRTAIALALGAFHSCALLDDGRARCWGFGGDGRLGYGNVATIGDDESPGSVGPVDLGAGRSAKAITAGSGHSCALLDDGTVRCWGFGGDGRLGYAKPNPIGDDETPGSVGPADLGAGRTARAISAGETHTCAVLDDGSVRCWGFASNGQLGYANNVTIGENETPGSVGPVDLGTGRTARAISAGNGHTCALLDDGTVRCWGFGGNGRLGYGNVATIGDSETPGSVAPVNLGAGRTAVAISAGAAYTCAVLDDGTVRCWGSGADGRLGYGNTNDIGDDETPGSAGPVNLGPGRTAVAISAGGRHTCALLDDGSVRCWGGGALGPLGYCNESDIGDDETPGSVGPANLLGAVDCRPPAAPSPPALGPSPPVTSPTLAPATAKLWLARARVLRSRQLLDVLALVTRRASGSAKVDFRAAGRSSRFSARIDSGKGRIPFRHRIAPAQARLGTGILTISYPGDADTRPHRLRLRAASRPANLRLTRPLIRDGRLSTSGTVARRARGLVRVQIEYVHRGITRVARFRARIDAGRWRLNRALPTSTRAELATRTGPVHSYAMFTGYLPRRVRGEMRSYQVLP